MPATAHGRSDAADGTCVIPPTRAPAERSPGLPAPVATRRWEPPDSGRMKRVVAATVAVLGFLAASVAVDSVGFAIAALGLAVGTGLVAVLALSET